MNCTKFIEDMSLYLDNMLSEDERIEFEGHLKECEACSLQLNNLRLMLECINEIDEIELPSDFEATLHDKLTKETTATTKKNRFPFRLKVITSIAASIAVVIIGITAINQLPGNFGISMKSTGDNAAPMERSEAEFGVANEESQDFSKSLNILDVPMTQSDGVAVRSKEESLNDTLVMTTSAQRKIIKQGSLILETDAFDEAYAKIIQMIEGKDGYIQHSQTYFRYLDRENPENSLRYSNMTLRVPSSQFTEIFNQIKAMGKVTNENIGGEDITESYRNIERELENLEIQEARFQDILKQADKVEDILRIENELARVRNQINHLKASLINYDKLVDMSTLSLELEEVKDLSLRIQSSNEGVWNKAKNNFIKSINNIIAMTQRGFIGLFGLLPALAILGAIGGPLSIYICKKAKKRRN